jgi:hypothetical protein
MKMTIVAGSFFTVFLLLMLPNINAVGHNNIFQEEISNNQIKVFNNLRNNDFTETTSYNEYVFTLKVFLIGKIQDSFYINSSDFSIGISALHFIGGFSYKLYDSAGLFESTSFPFMISGIPILQPQLGDRGNFINGSISIEAIGWGFGKIIIIIHAD